METANRKGNEITSRCIYNRLTHVVDMSIDHHIPNLSDPLTMRKIIAERARTEFQLYHVNNHIIYLPNRLSPDDDEEEDF